MSGLLSERKIINRKKLWYNALESKIPVEVVFVRNYVLGTLVRYFVHLITSGTWKFTL